MALLLDYLAEGSLFYWKHDTAMPARIIGTLSTSNSFRHAFRSLGPTLFPSLSIGRGSVTYDASEVPPSILSHILGFLSDDKVALRACSLACQRWRRAAQPILFRNVRICDEASLIRVANVFDVVPKAEMWISEILLGGGAQRPTCPAWLSLLSSQLLNVYSTITFIQFRNIDPSLEPAFIVSLANFTNVHRLEFDGCTLGEEALWAIICAFPNLRHLTIRNFRRLEAGGQYHYMPYSNDPHALQAKGPLTGLPFLYPPRLQSLEVTHDNKEGLSAHYQLHSTLYRLARSGTTDTLHSMTWLTNEHLDLAKMETWSLNTFMYSLTNLKYVNMKVGFGVPALRLPSAPDVLNLSTIHTCHWYDPSRTTFNYRAECHDGSFFPNVTTLVLHCPKRRMTKRGWEAYVGLENILISRRVYSNLKRLDIHCGFTAGSNKRRAERLKSIFESVGKTRGLVVNMYFTTP